jgi:hypothetical protein
MILEPAGARFSTASTDAPAPQEPNRGLTNLVVSVDKRSSPTTIAVVFSTEGDDTKTRIEPLAAWK